jgi:hypothetical protein
VGDVTLQMRSDLQVSVSGSGSAPSSEYFPKPNPKADQPSLPLGTLGCGYSGLLIGLKHSAASVIQVVGCRGETPHSLWCA